MSIRSTLLTTLLFLGCASVPMDGPDEHGAPFAGDAVDPGAEGLDDVSLKVFYGTAGPTLVPLTPGQIKAIGQFPGVCSGTVVAQRWVATAAHCVLPQGAEICFGNQPNAKDVCVDTLRTIDHPDWDGGVYYMGDITLVELPRDIRDIAPDIEPIPLFDGQLDESWIGRRGEASGYGTDENGDTGTRAFTAEPLVALSSRFVTIDGEGRHGVCFGDSGGPLMVSMEDGTTRIIGVLSNGDGSCVDEDNFTRIDTYKAWLEGYMGPIGGPLEVDSDGDAIPDDRDNCPLVPNPNQQDLDQDGLGDACDSTPTPEGPEETDERGGGELDSGDPGSGSSTGRGAEDCRICDACTADADCGPDGYCSDNGICFQSCQTDADCPGGDTVKCEPFTGYSACVNVDYPAGGLCPQEFVCGADGLGLPEFEGNLGAGQNSDGVSGKFAAGVRFQGGCSAADPGPVNGLFFALVLLVGGCRRRRN